MTVQIIRSLLSAKQCQAVIQDVQSRSGWTGDSPSPAVLEVDPWREFDVVLDAMRTLANQLGIVVNRTPMPMRVLHYRPEDECGWHVDYRPSDSHRKVSCSVVMESENHVFEYINQEGTERFYGVPGDVIVFAGWIPHRVVPSRTFGGMFTSHRWSLAAWLTGPRFE